MQKLDKGIKVILSIFRSLIFVPHSCGEASQKIAIQKTAYSAHLLISRDLKPVLAHNF